ncbi:MAG TPA: copper resistance protein CopC [Acidimicrobiales bacterium]
MSAIFVGGWSLRRVLVAVGLCLVATGATLAGTARPAMAHATLLSTVPTGDELLASVPDAVELRFDEPVEVLDGAVRVFGPDGERVDLARVEVKGAELSAPIDATQRGTYTVAWRVLSEDSHNLSGSFVFHVGERSGAVAVDDSDNPLVDAAGTIGRLLALSGAALLFGAGVVTMLAAKEERVAAKLRPLVLGASAGAVLGVALVLVGRAAASSGRSLPDAIALTPDLTTGTRTGLLTLGRALLLIATGAFAVTVPLWRRAAWAALAATGTAMVLTTLAGHAWTAEQRAIAVASDVTHQLAVGIWIGGAVALLAVLRSSDDRGRLARRFSGVAIAAAGVVAVTGTISAFIQIGSLEALTSTGYGQLVIAKVIGFAVLVTFGWLNRRHLVPIAERAAAPLIRSLRWEVLVAAMVLTVTAVLIDQPPGRTAVDRPFAATVTADDATLQMTVEPARTGANDLHLYFYDTRTGEVLPVDAVEITAGTADIPPRRLDVVPITASHVSVLGATFPATGTWNINVTLVRAGQPTTVTLEVPIR